MTFHMLKFLETFSLESNQRDVAEYLSAFSKPSKVQDFLSDWLSVSLKAKKFMVHKDSLFRKIHHGPRYVPNE